MMIMMMTTIQLKNNSAKSHVICLIYLIRKNTADKTHFLTLHCAAHGLKAASHILVFSYRPALVVRRLDTGIHRINQYQGDK